MDQQPAPKSQQKVLRGDFVFACSMLLVCCVFAAGLISVPFWEFKQRQKLISAQVTSTAFAMETQQANITATAVAHWTEQAQYSFIDPFDDNHEYWLTESGNDEFAKYTLRIIGGIYRWDMYEVKQPFLYWSNVRRRNWVEDFDMYVDSKINPADGTPGEVCTGFVFRTASWDWEDGAYTFSVCNDSYFDVDYYSNGEWDVIADWTYSDAIQAGDWNRLEISGRGNRFTFRINQQVVFEMTDDRLSAGGLGLLVEINEAKPVSIWFDNFGLEIR
jgi:hypothetical protein